MGDVSGAQHEVELPESDRSEPALSFPVMN
jgi:hypothetical protein